MPQRSFLCSGNFARSIVAEAIMNRKGRGNFTAFSAGSHPTGAVRPEALRQIEKAMLSTTEARSKSWDEFSKPDSPRLRQRWRYAGGVPGPTTFQLLSSQKLLVFWSNRPAGSLRDCALRQSRNNLDARPKRCDRLLDHESLVRQVRHNPLDDHECGEAEDRVPPGVGYHYVIPTWQPFILGNIEKELHETSKQRRANVVDVLSGADTVAVLRPEEDVAKLLWMGSAELNQAT
jgi:hypothetical protein